MKLKIRAGGIYKKHTNKNVLKFDIMNDNLKPFNVAMIKQN